MEKLDAPKPNIRYEHFWTFLKNKFVLSGLVVRLILAPFFIHQYDFTEIVSAARAYYSSWTLTYFTYWPYPLFSYLLLLISYFPADLISDGFYLFGQSISVSEKLFIKLPFIISDLLTAYVLYRILSENGKEKYAMFITLFYLLNPLSIYMSSVLGNFDPITILFSVLSFYHFLHRRYGLSGLELGIGFGIKFQPAILIPIFLLFMWNEAKGKIPKFILCFGVPATLSLILQAIIYYDPLTHYWSFGLLTPNFISYSRNLLILQMDPNMTYRALLLRFGFYEILQYGTLITVAVFAGLFLLFIFLVKYKGLFERYSQSRLEYLAACVIAVYIIFYLSYDRIGQYYALWALPFLLIFFSFRDLNRFLLLTFNFIPLVQNFSRDSIFYYMNGNYTSIGVGWIAGYATPYGVGWGMGVAAGFVFSLTCVLIFVSLFRDTFDIYQPFKKIYQFFNQISERRKTILLSLLLISIYFLLLSSMNINELYWSGYPVTFYLPMEWGIIPQQAQYLLSFLLLFGLPLSLFISISLRANALEPDRNRWRYLKLAILLISISLLIILGCIILNATLPYIASGNGFFYGWIPVFGILRVLCEHGGIITTGLILISSAIALDLLSKPWTPSSAPSNFIELKC